MVRPLRRGGGGGFKAGPLKKKNFFFEALKTKNKALVVGPIVEELFFVVTINADYMLPT